MIEDCQQVTDRNCWWAIYEAAPFVQRVAREVLAVKRLPDKEGTGEGGVTAVADVLAKAAYKAVYRWQRPDLPEQRWEEAWDELPGEPDGISALGLPRAKETFRVLARAVLEAAGYGQPEQTEEEEERLPMVAFRFEQRQVNGRWLVRVFAGPDEQHLACAGELLLRPDEWRKLHLMLGLSAPKVGPIHLEIANGESEVALDWARKE